MALPRYESFALRDIATSVADDTDLAERGESVTTGELASADVESASMRAADSITSNRSVAPVQLKGEAVAAATAAEPLQPPEEAMSPRGAEINDTQSVASGVSAPSVSIYTAPGCHHCVKAKDAMRSKGLAYEEIDVSRDSDLRRWLAEVTGKRTVPQIFLNSTSIGGADDLLASINDGSFDKLVHASSVNGRESEEKESESPKGVEHAMGSMSLMSSFATPTSPEGKPSPALLALAAEMRDPRTGVTRSKMRLRHVRGSQPNVFTGRQAIDWLLRHQRLVALSVMQQMMEARLITVIADDLPSARGFQVVDDDEHHYRLTADASAKAKAGKPLNATYWWYGPARAADKVAEELRQRIAELYDKYISNDGRTVFYRKMREDPLFWEFVDATAELQKVDLTPLNRSELMAMFINLYNVLVIHALVVLGTDAMDNLAKRMVFYNNDVKYNIAGNNYTADDIEHGVLRGNRPGGSSLARIMRFQQPGDAPFGKTDARARLVVDPLDPRIHFALVCGAKSCPPIRVYTADNLQEALTTAAETFCESEVEVDAKYATVRMSKIFKWYASDFGANKTERLQYLLTYLSPKSREELAALLEAGADINVVYKKYDWSVNSDEK